MEESAAKFPIQTDQTKPYLLIFEDADQQCSNFWKIRNLICVEVQHLLLSGIWPFRKQIIHAFEILFNSVEIIKIYFLIGFHISGVPITSDNFQSLVCWILLKPMK